MAYKKFLVVASKQDIAGINITTQLSQFRKNPLLGAMSKDAKGFDFYLVEEDILHEENLDLEKINKYDFIIFASKHEAEKGKKTLSIHAPGNWRFAKFGGKKYKAGKTSSQFMKQFFEKLHKNKEEYNLKDYEVTMEATHHGPLIEKPSAFVEMGPTENEWKDRRACFVLGKTIFDVINSLKENPYNENAIAIGGPHYCPNFNKIQLKSNFAISHVIPSYVFPLEKSMVLEATEKTEEEIDFVLLDWKGLGNKDRRQEVLDILDNLHLNYKKTSEISK